ncbi:hypothetical protein D3C85_1241300 [compost metagenome]
MQAAINDSRITPAAMNISRSRSGNAPPPMSIGTDITPASVTAPRTPPTVSNQQDRAVGTWVTSPLPRKRRSSTDNRQMLCTQTNRKASSTRKIATTSSPRYNNVGHSEVS